jgi:hypothetical protein
MSGSCDALEIHGPRAWQIFHGIIAGSSITIPMDLNVLVCPTWFGYFAA